MSLVCLDKDCNRAEKIKDSIIDKFGEDVQAFRNQYFIDIVPKGCSKGEALLRVLELEGESAVAASGCRYIIIRTSWLYSEYGRNFVKTMLELTATRPQLNVVSDQTGTPTYALDLAETIRHIVESGKSEGNEGIYHYSNEGICTWYDFAKAIAGYSGHTGCDIRPCTSDEYPSPVRRPAYSVLDKTKIKKVFGIEVPFWTDSLEECLKNITRI